MRGIPFGLGLLANRLTATKIRINYRLFGALLGFTAAIPHLMAAPWEGYGATRPVARYDLDPEYDPNYRFGIKETAMGYEDPDFSLALDLPSPFQDERFSGYNLIIIVNDNERERDPQVWGPPQTMRVYHRSLKRNGGLLYFWNISTGIDGAATRKGFFRPRGFSSRHWSQSYDAPMLSSVFFDGGKAFHSSMATSDLALMGKRRSSHGCIHIEDHRAQELFHLIGHSGMGAADTLKSSSLMSLDNPVEATREYGYRTLIIIH